MDGHNWFHALLWYYEPLRSLSSSESISVDFLAQADQGCADRRCGYHLFLVIPLYMVVEVVLCCEKSHRDCNLQGDDSASDYLAWNGVSSAVKEIGASNASRSLSSWTLEFHR